MDRYRVTRAVLLACAIWVMVAAVVGVWAYHAGQVSEARCVMRLDC